MKSTLSFLLLLLVALMGFAADINVDNSGAIAGSYPTIQDGINAATDGDRIVIYPTTEDYRDTLSINKSLTLMCASASEYWQFTGMIEVVPSPGREVSIIGLLMTPTNSNSVFSTQNNSTGARCVVNIIDSQVPTGINFDFDNFKVNFLYSKGNSLAFRLGSIIGSELAAARALNELPVHGVGDTIFVVGSKFTSYFGTPYFASLYLGNSSARYFIANCFLSANTERMVGVVAADVTGEPNWFINNTVVGTFNSSITNCANTPTRNLVILQGAKDDHIINNLFAGTATGNNYGCALGNDWGDYNYFVRLGQSPNAYSFHNTYFNYFTSPYPIHDANTGVITTATFYDLGKPGVNYYDLDLTRNDIGTAGGPFSWWNYHPESQNAPGRTRVMLLDIPSRIYSLTGNVPVKASGVHIK
ncbi:MAG: hypothetical protein H6581_20155 [Bacteroidia bacterium]|nr:hypothetical protein [Bacteroidia bacterium]